MTPERALVRVGRLLALAVPGSGASREEARTAAMMAAALIVEHRLLDREHGVHLGDVTRMALRLIELERALAAERAARDAEVRRRDTVPCRRRT